MLIGQFTGSSTATDQAKPEVTSTSLLSPAANATVDPTPRRDAQQASTRINNDIFSQPLQAAADTLQHLLNRELESHPHWNISTSI